MQGIEKIMFKSGWWWTWRPRKWFWNSLFIIENSVGVEIVQNKYSSSFIIHDFLFISLIRLDRLKKIIKYFKNQVIIRNFVLFQSSFNLFYVYFFWKRLIQNLHAIFNEDMLEINVIFLIMYQKNSFHFVTYIINNFLHVHFLSNNIKEV